MSVWDDPATALGHVYNVITNDELKGYRPFLPTSLSVDIFISRCRYVVLFFHHFFWICLYDWVCIISSLTCFHQVLGESLHITTDYLDVEEKVVDATSKAESVEVECSKLKKDLIAIMNERNDANQKIEELTEALRVEKSLVIQKDKEIQVALLKTDEERDKIIQKFSSQRNFQIFSSCSTLKGSSFYAGGQ